jgi:hypothetical protein
VLTIQMREKQPRGRQPNSPNRQPLPDNLGRELARGVVTALIVGQQSPAKPPAGEPNVAEAVVKSATSG